MVLIFRGRGGFCECVGGPVTPIAFGLGLYQRGVVLVVSGVFEG